MADFRKTHRGQTVDIDLIRMKQELELKEINKINIKREKDVDTKRRRNGNQNNKISEMLANQELVRQKLREQKRKKEDENEASSEPVKTSEAPKKEEKKDKPEVTGRRIVRNNGNGK
jgi:hypothetical protein